MSAKKTIHYSQIECQINSSIQIQDIFPPQKKRKKKEENINYIWHKCNEFMFTSDIYDMVNINVCQTMLPYVCRIFDPFAGAGVGAGANAFLCKLHHPSPQGISKRRERFRAISYSHIHSAASCQYGNVEAKERERLWAEK